VEKRLMDLETCLARKHDIVSGEIDGEMFLMSIESGQYYVLNDTASRVWEILEESSTIARICETLQEEYRIDPEGCQRDTVAFVHELLTRNIIVTI
jgi:hypothetical protein